MASTDQPASPASPAPSLPFPLQDGETIIELCRRHWIFLWPLMAFQLVIAVLPIAIVRLVLDGTAGDILTLVALLWLVFWLLRMLLNWYRYHHDIWVITNQRLIDSYRRHPFNLLVSTADLINVQDMTVQRSGILQSTLDFGTIICQTASSDREFKISGVPNPRATQILVDKERDRERMRVRGL